MITIDIAEIQIYYTRNGFGDTFLIFPDNHLTSLAYEKEIDHFANDFEVIAFDYPTTGKSTHEIKYPDERQVDYWGFLADLACHLLLELKINQCYALGVGGGALTALHFAGKQAPQHNINLHGLILDSFLADWDSRTLHRWLDVREHYYVRNEKSLSDQHGKDWRQVLDEDTKYSIHVTCDDRYDSWWYSYDSASSVTGGLIAPQTRPTPNGGNIQGFQFEIN